MNSIDGAHAVTAALSAVLERAGEVTAGAVADYIPELGTADPALLGIAVASTRGRVYEAGDSRAPFTIQSVSKPFVYALAIDELGEAAVRERVGVEPSGEPFNAISVDEETGRPLNPMINAGAIVVASLIRGADASMKLERILAGLGAFAGRDLSVDAAVYESELATGDRNRALAWLAHAAGVLGSDVDTATEAYFAQCSVTVTARDLAIMAATLANGGRNPVTGAQVVSEASARWTTAVMASCGMYDASGEWLARVGLPAKSGVGGGIAAVDPGHFGIGTFSPPLDARGNPVRGLAILEQLSSEHGMHLFGHQGEALSPIEAVEEIDGVIHLRLRGEIGFSGAEDVLAAIDPDGQPLHVDLTAVTRVRPTARTLFQATIAGTRPITLTDPSGFFDPAS